MVEEGNVPLSRRQLGRIGSRAFSLAGAAFWNHFLWGYGRVGYEMAWKWRQEVQDGICGDGTMIFKGAIWLDHAARWRGIICPADPPLGHFCATTSRFNVRFQAPGMVRDFELSRVILRVVKTVLRHHESWTTLYTCT